MAVRVLFFFPHNLFTGATGAHQRGLESLRALSEIGCDITLFGSHMFTDALWATPLPDSARVCNRVIIHEPTVAEACALRVGRFAYRVARKVSRRLSTRVESSTFRNGTLCPDSMRTLFRKTIEEHSPEVIFMNYAHWDALVDHHRCASITRVVDTHDLLSVAMSMRKRLARAVAERHGVSEPCSEELFREDFYSGCYDITATVRDECAVYDKYDDTIVISEQDAQIIRQCTTRTRVVTIPMTREPVSVVNSYDGAAIFCAGDNPYNRHGLMYLCKMVIPSVLQKAPDAHFAVTGGVCGHVRTCGRVVQKGVLPDLRHEYARARFAVNPVVGGTGQQIKVVDAMAHGLPVVALRQAAGGSLIEHGETGFLANSAEEFAEYVNRLWADRDLCKRMGGRSRELVRSKCSPKKLRDAFSCLIRPRGSDVVRK